MKNKSLIIAGIILLILIGTCIFFANRINTKSYQNLNLPNTQESVVGVVQLCETENPGFNPAQECQKAITEKYPGRECTFELGLTQWLPFGSCRNCTISCK